MNRFRSWLHAHGIHRACRARFVWHESAIVGNVLELDGRRIEINNLGNGWREEVHS